MLDFNYGADQFFAEDSYDIDSRNDNRCLQLSFFKFQLDNSDQAPIFSTIYYFDEKLREQEDAKLSPKNRDMLISSDPPIWSFVEDVIYEISQMKEDGYDNNDDRPWLCGYYNLLEGGYDNRPWLRCYHLENNGVGD